MRPNQKDGTKVIIKSQFQLLAKHPELPSLTLPVPAASLGYTVTCIHIHRRGVGLDYIHDCQLISDLQYGAKLKA